MNTQFSFLAADPQFATRIKPQEEEDNLRTKYDRDRDRILFSKEFRRLEGKTQVFINGFDDHIRNRLTHTLEVSQISESIVKYFGFNQSLAEAISLGHDVGHTPFGHVGERVLNFFTNNCEEFYNLNINSISDRGFKHNWQGIKVVSTLEKISPEYKGLNLTDFTLWGILNHSSLTHKKCNLCHEGICNYRNRNKSCHVENQEFSLEHYNMFSRIIKNESFSLEGLVVNYADEIAQRHHDIEDGLIAKIIDKKELVENFHDFFCHFLNPEHNIKLINIDKEENNIEFVLHDFSSLILNLYSVELIRNTENNLQSFLKESNVASSEDFNAYKQKSDTYHNLKKLIAFTKEFEEADKKFHKYLINRILNSHLAQTMDGKANYILKNIIEAYLANPKLLPDGTLITLFKKLLSKGEFDSISRNRSPKLISGILRDEVDKLQRRNDETYQTALIRTITDFISGMTDRFAISQYKMLYGSDNFWES